MQGKSSHSLPPESLLQDSFQPRHYVDAYAADFHDPEGRIGPREVALAFFQSAPSWVGGLMRLRDRIVGRFGLKTSRRDKGQSVFRGEPGERMGIFKVIAASAQELILGEDDRHLDFRVSLFIGPALSADPAAELALSDSRTGAALSDSRTGSLTISTVVRFHNRWGRLYFWPVRPIHKRIVPVMLKGTIARLEAPKADLT